MVAIGDDHATGKWMAAKVHTHAVFHIHCYRLCCYHFIAYLTTVPCLQIIYVVQAQKSATATTIVAPPALVCVVCVRACVCVHVCYCNSYL